MKKDTFLRKGYQKIAAPPPVLHVFKRGQRSIIEPKIGLEYALTLVRYIKKIS